jgi:type I restriction enzyme R subunit
MEHILQLEDGKKRYLAEVTALSKAFALAVPHEEALKIRDEVGFFQEVRAGLAKATVEGEGKSPEEMDTAIRQLVSRAVASEEVIDIFAAAGLKKRISRFSRTTSSRKCSSCHTVISLWSC